MSKPLVEVVVPVRFTASQQERLVDFVSWIAENSQLICSLFEDETELDTKDPVYLELMPDSA